MVCISRIIKNIKKYKYRKFMKRKNNTIVNIITTITTNELITKINENDDSTLSYIVINDEQKSITSIYTINKYNEQL